MSRQKKDGVYINYYIDKEIKDRLDAYSQEVGQTNTLAIERILKQFFDNRDKEVEELLSQTMPIIDESYLCRPNNVDEEARIQLQETIDKLLIIDNPESTHIAKTLESMLKALDK